MAERVSPSERAAVAVRPGETPADPRLAPEFGVRVSPPNAAAMTSASVAFRRLAAGTKQDVVTRRALPVLARAVGNRAARRLLMRQQRDDSQDSPWQPVIFTGSPRQIVREFIAWMSERRPDLNYSKEFCVVIAGGRLHAFVGGEPRGSFPLLEDAEPVGPGVYYGGSPTAGGRSARRLEVHRTTGALRGVGLAADDEGTAFIDRVSDRDKARLEAIGRTATGYAILRSGVRSVGDGNGSEGGGSGDREGTIGAMNGVSRPLRPGFCDLETAQMAPSHGACPPQRIRRLRADARKEGTVEHLLERPARLH